MTVQASSRIATAALQAELKVGDSGIRIDVMALRSKDGGPPAEFRILKAGLNESMNGDFMFTAQSGVMCMEYQTKRGGRDTLIDWEHAAMRAGWSDGDPKMQGRAAGWCKLELRDGELHAVKCRWTDEAKTAMTGEVPTHRYFSPVVHYDRESREVAACSSIGLTNTPALLDVPALAAKQNPPPNEAPMNPELQKLIAMLSLNSGASGTDALLAVQQMKTDLDALLGVTGAKTGAEALGMVQGFKKNTEQLATLKAEIQTMSENAAKAERVTIIETALKERRVAPAEREFLEKLDTASLKGYLAVRAVGSVGGTSPADPAPGSAHSLPAQPGALNEALLKVAEMMGNTDPKQIARLTELASRPINAGALPGKVAPVNPAAK